MPAPVPSPDQIVGRDPAIQIHVYPHAPRNVTPRFPDALVTLVRAERMSEPNRQHLVCNTCGFAYTLKQLSGQRCTQRTRGAIQCRGTIQGHWSQGDVVEWLKGVHKDPNTGLAIAWMENRPVAFMVTKPLHEDEICRAFNWPIGALQQIKKWSPDGGTFLTVLAIWIDPMVEQEALNAGMLFGKLMDALFMQATKSLESPMMPILFPLGTEPGDRRLEWFNTHVGDGHYQTLKLGDPPSTQRQRVLLAFDFHNEKVISRS